MNKRMFPPVLFLTGALLHFASLRQGAIIFAAAWIASFGAGVLYKKFEKARSAGIPLAFFVIPALVALLGSSITIGANGHPLFSGTSLTAPDIMITIGLSAPLWSSGAFLCVNGSVLHRILAGLTVATLIATSLMLDISARSSVHLGWDPVAFPLAAVAGVTLLSLLAIRAWLLSRP